jgi:peptide/nickel transport system substrate-binding protein
MTAKDFRVAVSLSIDKQSVTDTYLHGWGKPQNMSFHPGALFYDRVENTRNLYTVQDVDRSNELLDGLGLTERDADGWRMRADGGGRLNLRIDNVSFATGGIQSDDLVEGVATYIRDVGLNLSVNLVAGPEWGAYTRDNRVMMGGPYGFQGGRYPPLPDRHWGAKMQTWAITGGREGKAPTDPKMKRMYDLAALAGPLPYEDRGDYYVEMYNILSEEQFITGIQYGAPLQNSFSIVKNNFKNTDAPGWISRYQNGAYAAVRPEQFFFEGGLNDEGY